MAQDTGVPASARFWSCKTTALLALRYGHSQVLPLGAVAAWQLPLCMTATACQPARRLLGQRHHQLTLPAPSGLCILRQSRLRLTQLCMLPLKLQAMLSLSARASTALQVSTLPYTRLTSACCATLHYGTGTPGMVLIAEGALC